jgi:2-desacetyl-2-hydroxyethyl bacteriochlorophyllide A dehydrogenase
MQAILFEKPRTIRRIETEEVPPPGRGEALVRVHRVGICGTDISCYLGKFPFFDYPRIPGHELGVEVLKIGPGVENVKPGQRCSVEPYMNDPASYATSIGRPNCCEHLQVIGVMCDGGMRERFVIRADKLHPGGDLAYEQLALVETLAIGCHAVDRAALVPQDDVLIIGAGPIGLSVLEFVKLAGITPIVLDTNEDRLRFCREKMGVKHTLVPSGEIVQDLRDITDGHLPTIVFDATGSSKSMSVAFGYVAPGGKLVFVGITTDEVSFRHAPFHKVEGTLLCSRNALPKDFRRIIGHIQEGELDTAPWITHRTPLADLPEVFDSYTRPETGAVKAIVEVP